MTIVEVKAKLDALGTLGQITMDFMPGSPDAIGTLYTYTSPVPEGRFGVDGVGYEHVALQLVFRGAAFDSATPRLKAERAYQYLAGIDPGPIGAGYSTEYLRIWPRQSPFMIRPIDANNRHYIGFNFYVMKEPSAL